MSKELSSRIIAFLLALLGLLILWQSTLWGIQAAQGILSQLRSVSGDIQNQVLYESPVAALRVIGGILLGIGLYRVFERSKAA